MKWIIIIGLITLIIFFVTRKKNGKQPTKTITQPDMQTEEQVQEYSSTEISEEKLRQIENEIATDRKKYLQNCNRNYSVYVRAAQKLFADTYDRMEKMDAKGDPWTKYSSKAQQLIENKDIEGEIALLEKAVADNIYTPGTYERLAILYGKKKDIQSAHNICKKWFESDYWKIPNMASTSLRLLDRLEKLEEKNKTTGGKQNGV